MSHIYLFVVCPNNSGGTLVAQLLSTSPNVSAILAHNHEGQWVTRMEAPDAMPYPQGDEARNWTINPEKFGTSSSYDWPTIRTLWHRAWNLDKKILLEKTPAMVIAAPLFARHFENSRFILSIRNPYAFCEGVRRKQGRSVTTAATHWVRSARFQLRNRQQLPLHVFFTYEELCDDRATTAEKIEKSLPELGSLDLHHCFHIMSRQDILRNFNQEQISRLGGDDVVEINNVLSQHRPLVEGFGYKFL